MKQTIMLIVNFLKTQNYDIDVEENKLTYKTVKKEARKFRASFFTVL